MSLPTKGLAAWQLQLSHSSAFDFDSRVIHAPELDDLHDLDDLRPLRLAMPAAFRARLSNPLDTATLPPPGDQRVCCLSRRRPTGSTSALPATSGIQVVAVSPPPNSARIDQLYATGMAFAQERATREAGLQRPLFVCPTQGIPTSSFGTRWGALHAGIDIANAIGTPILAAADGVAIYAGPVAG